VDCVNHITGVEFSAAPRRLLSLNSRFALVGCLILAGKCYVCQEALPLGGRETMIFDPTGVAIIGAGLYDSSIAAR
jgi:hypothetical protein